jgi:NDP-sugar pyrophosphorylase family protein
MKPTLLVLAAGIGSRYGGLKQIDPVGPHGEIVIDYSIYDALRAGFGKLVFVIRKEIEEVFREVIGSKFEDKAEVVYVFQELDDLPPGFSLPPERKKPWGTAHAVMAARDAIKEPFAVINADDFYGRQGYGLLYDHFQSKASAAGQEYSLVGFVLRNTLSEHGSVARGVCSSEDDEHLSSVVEMTRIEMDGDAAFHTEDDGSKTVLTGDEWVSMNMWGFTPGIFGQMASHFADFLRDHGHEPKAEFFIPMVVDELIRDREATVRILASSDKWFGVTYPDDKPYVVENVRRLIDEGVYPEQLWPQA